MALLLFIMFFILAVYIYKKHEKPMWKIILCFIGYILLSIGIVGFPNIHEEGISFFIGLIYFISTLMLVLSGIFLILYVVFESKVKNTSSIKKKAKYINSYTMSFLIIFLSFIGFSLINYAERKQGESLGFSPNMDFSQAKRNHIYNVDEYSKFLSDKKAKEENDLATKAEKDRIAAIEQANKDTECAKDAYCYYTTHSSAEYACAKEIQKLAKYKFEWVDKFYEKKFTSSRWIDQNKKIVQVFGDRATAQNGFGATQNASYSCTFNADTGEVLYATLN